MKIITRYWTKGNLFKTVLLSFFLALMMSIVFGNRLGNFAGSIVTVRCIVVTLSGVISLNYYYHMYEQFKSEFYLRITLGDTVAEISECFAQKPIKFLSGGQKQRLMIARALIKKPPIILADEPTAALDKHNVDLVYDLLKQRAQAGSTVITVTHDISFSEKFSRVLKLDKGHLKEV